MWWFLLSELARWARLPAAAPTASAGGTAARLPPSGCFPRPRALLFSTLTFNLKVERQNEANTPPEQGSRRVSSTHLDVQRNSRGKAEPGSCCPSALLLLSPQDVKSAGVVQAALPGAIPTVPNTELADVTSFQGIDEPTSPSAAASLGTRNDRAVGRHDQQPCGQSASSEEEGEAEDKSCEMTRKRSQRLADSLMRFSIDLLRVVQLESNRTNVILSPLSIALALAHLALGNFLVTKAPFPALPCAPSCRQQEPGCKLQTLNMAPSTSFYSCRLNYVRSRLQLPSTALPRLLPSGFSSLFCKAQCVSGRRQPE